MADGHGGKRDGAGRPTGSQNKPAGPSDNQIAYIEKLAREFTEEAMILLMEIARDEEITPGARVTALAHVLDRGYGKPTQAIEHGGEVETTPVVTDNYQLARAVLDILSSAGEEKEEIEAKLH